MALKDKTSSKMILEEGMKGEFWKILLEALEGSKQLIQEEQDGTDMANLSPEQYKVDNEVLKARKEYIDKLSRLPQEIIESLENPDNKERNFDPYEPKP